MVLHRSNAMSVGILESEKLIAADVSAQLRISPFLPFRVDWPDETTFLVGLRVHNNIYHYGQFPPRNPPKSPYRPGLSFLFTNKVIDVTEGSERFSKKPTTLFSAKKDEGYPIFSSCDYQRTLRLLPDWMSTNHRPATRSYWLSQ